MLTWVLLGAAVLLLLLVAFIASRPGHYRVERATTIAAPPGAVLDLVEDFAQWKRWSPWERIDPTQTTTLGGAPRGLGATYRWVGKKTGEGMMEIVEYRPNELVGISLEFVKPFASRCRTDFAVKPLVGLTHVTWSMVGTNNFVAKAFCLLRDMDRMIGKDFERGLADLKAAAESSAGTRGESLGATGVGARRV